MTDTRSDHVSKISKTCGHYIPLRDDDDKCSHPQNRSAIDTFLYCGNDECPIRRGAIQEDTATDTRSEFEQEMDAAKYLRADIGFDPQSFRDGFLAALKLLGDLPTERTKSLREQAERAGCT